MVFNHLRTFLSHLETETDMKMCIWRQMQACVSTGISGCVYEHILQCWESNNEHFGVFAALLLTAAEAMQSIIQRFRAAPAVHARNSAGGNRVTHCVVLYCEKT